MKGWSHTQNTEVYVPAFLVYVAWHEHPERVRHDEPLFAYPNLAGIAAGPSMDYALLSGLEEVIERDASMVWWHNAQALPELQMSQDLRELIADRAERTAAPVRPSGQRVRCSRGGLSPRLNSERHRGHRFCGP
ncbi:hypothetical protein GCM10020256_74850 [Streptomyces thermocoprophilus]